MTQKTLYGGHVNGHCGFGRKRCQYVRGLWEMEEWRRRAMKFGRRGGYNEEIGCIIFQYRTGFVAG